MSIYRRAPVFWVFFICAILAMQTVGAENGRKPVTNDLLEYIVSAQKIGVPEPQIRQSAMQAGWDSSAFDEAFTSVRTKATSSQTNTAAANDNDAAAYHIAPGDILQISVWKEPEASAAVMVRPDGRIATPLLKEVDVGGLTARQAEKLVTERLSKVIRDPNVTVIVATIRRVYVMGAVRKEGPIQFRYNMTVLQALSEAGGLAEDAKRKNISVLRTQNGKQTRLPFNYEAVTKGERVEENILVAPDDTIVVPR